jgi:hypothetical protein
MVEKQPIHEPESEPRAIAPDEAAKCFDGKTAIAFRASILTVNDYLRRNFHGPPLLVPAEKLGPTPVIHELVAQEFRDVGWEVALKREVNSYSFARLSS